MNDPEFQFTRLGPDHGVRRSRTSPSRRSRKTGTRSRRRSRSAGRCADAAASPGTVWSRGLRFFFVSNPDKLTTLLRDLVMDSPGRLIAFLRNQAERPGKTPFLMAGKRSALAEDDRTTSAGRACFVRETASWRRAEPTSRRRGSMLDVFSILLSACIRVCV